MIAVLHPWQIVVVASAGWINRQQLDVIEYLKEENRTKETARPLARRMAARSRSMVLWMLGWPGDSVGNAGGRSNFFGRIISDLAGNRGW